MEKWSEKNTVFRKAGQLNITPATGYVNIIFGKKQQCRKFWPNIFQILPVLPTVERSDINEKQISRKYVANPFENAYLFLLLL